MRYAMSSSMKRPSDARRAMRVDIACPAQLRETGASRFTVNVNNLSVTGFRCETGFTLAKDTRIWLTFPGMGALEAIVEWRDGNNVGCSFIQPLHIAVFDHIARLHPARD